MTRAANNMTAKKQIHPLLIRGKQLTDKVWTWTLKDHPHTVVASGRAFQIRIYHYVAKSFDPYLVTIVSKEGWVMDATPSPNPVTAQTTPLQMLDDLDPPPDHPSIAQIHADRVEQLTEALITAIETAGANYPQAKHALTRALGALIGANLNTDTDLNAAVTIAANAIAGCAKSPPIFSKYAHRLRSTPTRLN